VSNPTAGDSSDVPPDDRMWPEKDENGTDMRDRILILSTEESREVTII